MSKTDIKKGDEVVIIAGAEKGKRGEIIAYDRVDERVTVKGLNLVKRHLKRAQDGTGGITEKEAPIHRSNVMLASLWEVRQSKKPAAKKAKAAK
ncbi:MAG: 50S ribosomal protein L24 [Opitutae bacterium]